jgi:hypothetical protein
VDQSQLFEEAHESVHSGRICGLSGLIDDLLRPHGPIRAPQHGEHRPSGLGHAEAEVLQPAFRASLKSLRAGILPHEPRQFTF